MEVFKLEDNRFFNLQCAVKFCNSILLNSGSHGLFEFLLDDIRKHSFDMSDAFGVHIANQIRRFVNEGGQLNVKLYKPLNPWSRAYGYHSPSNPFDININERKMQRSIASFVATLVHEMVHAVDGADLVHSYGHGSNSKENKQNTAPYWIGSRAAFYYSGTDPEEYPRYVRSSLWQRIKRLFV